MSQIRILDSTIERLKPFNERLTGALFGFVESNVLYVIGFYIGPSRAYDLDKEKSIVLNYPAPVDICGIVAYDHDVSDEVLHSWLQESSVTDLPLFLELSMEGIKVYNLQNGDLQEVKYSIFTAADLQKDFLYVRVQAGIPIFCLADLTSVCASIEDSCSFVTTSEVSFNYPALNFQVSSKEFYDRHKSKGPHIFVERLLDKSNTNKDTKPKKKLKDVDIDVLDAELLFPATINAFNGELGDLDGPLVIRVKQRSGNYARMTLNVDTLALVKRNTLLCDTHDALVLAVDKNLKMLQLCFMEHVDGAEVNSEAFPISFHFFVKELGHMITVVYPVGKSMADLVSYRQQLHEDLLLPKDMPYFSRSKAYKFSEDVLVDAPLVNPHEGLAPPPVKNAEISLVHGKYSYFHYMQQNTDDNGWGCAYRSLQTIVSWFRWQGYIEDSVPSHKDIQQCLVNIKDKPESFIGSRQWIGSMEVSFCLETMLGVTSRILRAESGADLASYAPELYEHFQKHGTPVMIGGGVLAHTIIGVAYDSETDDAMFLVLDPHYTGADDLAVIQKKGWCGWKKVNFWTKNAFYNLCLPQRPIGV